MRIAEAVFTMVGSLNFYFLITFFLAAGLPGSIICFLLLFLLKLAIKSLAMGKESHDTSTVTWAGSLEHIHLSVHAHQHFSKAHLPYSTPSSLKAPLHSLINFRSVSPAGLISHQNAEIQSFLHLTPYRSSTCSPPMPGERDCFTSHMSAKVSLLFTNTLDLPDSPCSAFHVLCMANSTDLCLDLQSAKSLACICYIKAGRGGGRSHLVN